MLDTFPRSSTYKSGKLSVDIRFKTHSDAKLASLLLDYDFPVHLFKQVFQLLQDPGFCLQDITFKDISEIYEQISDCRREVARERDSFPRSQHDDEPATLAATASIVPPVALDLVVNRMLEDNIPLDVEADQWVWKDVFEHNGVVFRNMSLVHRSWTSTAQNALRRRVVVPYHKIDRFLLNPLCGPWVREMIIYWTGEDDEIEITESHILLLDALLRRTPNVRSLSFNTSLAWPRVRNCPTFHVDRCLDILSARVPLLENLWLKHFIPWLNDDEEPYGQESQENCNEMFNLCTHIHKFRSLQRLSIQSWASPWQDERPLDWDKHPPCSLKSIELDVDDVPDDVGIRGEVLAWLLKPRNDYRLESLSIIDGLLSPSGESLEEIFPEVVDLRLYLSRQDALNMFGTASSTWARRIRNCTKLNNLELFMDNCCDLDCFRPSSSDLPSSLKRLAIYCVGSDLNKLLSSRESLSEFSSNLEAVLPRTPLLRNILVTTSQPLEGCPPYRVTVVEPLEIVVVQEFIKSFKEKHNIELSFIV